MAQDEPGRPSFDPASVLTGLGPGQSRLLVAAGDAIYAQGDLPDAALYVERGFVKIGTVVPSGKAATVGIRRAGDFFGTRCLVARRLGSASALTECSLIRITASALLRLLREVPDFAVMFAIYLVRQSCQDQAHLVDQLTEPAETRLAETLLRLANLADGGDGGIIPARINQTVLAEMIGTTRSRVNFFMNKFKKQGFIEYNRAGDVSVRHTLSRALAER